jgi:hypothetical protein
MANECGLLCDSCLKCSLCSAISNFASAELREPRARELGRQKASPDLPLKSNNET